MNKVYRNKKTKEVFLQISEDSEMVKISSMYDGKIIIVEKNMLNRIYEEIDVAPVKHEPTVIRVENKISNNLSFNDIQRILNDTDSDLQEYFKVGDMLFIPIEGFEKTVPIEIVHMDYEKRKMYLMSRDILAKMPMDKVDSYFEELLDKLPHDFVSHLKPIEHINKNGTHKTLISLPSIRNMGRNEEQCTGVDDIKLDKFETESRRCKDFKGETCWYWSDTPYAFNSTNFWYVYYNGGATNYGASNSFGVCPCFLLSKDEDECNE